MRDVFDMMEDSVQPADISEPDCDMFDHIGSAEVGMACHLAETMAEKNEEAFSEDDDEILSILSKEEAKEAGDQVEKVDPRKPASEVEVQPFEASVMKLCGLK